MRRIWMVVFLAVVLAGLSGLATAQQTTAAARPLSESDIALLRQDVQTQRMEIISKAMQLSDAEAPSFWSLYREYANEQQQIGDQRLRIIKDYAANYENMPEPKAGELVRRMIDLDRRTFETRSKYVPMFEKVLSPRRAAKFFQVDRRLSMMVDLQLASEIPILQ